MKNTLAFYEYQVGFDYDQYIEFDIDLGGTVTGTLESRTGKSVGMNGVVFGINNGFYHSDRPNFEITAAIDDETEATKLRAFFIANQAMYFFNQEGSFLVTFKNLGEFKDGVVKFSLVVLAKLTPDNVNISSVYCQDAVILVNRWNEVFCNQNWLGGIDEDEDDELLTATWDNINWRWQREEDAMALILDVNPAVNWHEGFIPTSIRIEYEAVGSSGELQELYLYDTDGIDYFLDDTTTENGLSGAEIDISGVWGGEDIAELRLFVDTMEAVYITNIEFYYEIAG
jgi:hypothetical protein